MDNEKANEQHESSLRWTIMGALKLLDSLFMYIIVSRI